MTSAELLIALLPVAERLALHIGGRVVEVNVAEVDRAALIAALEASKSHSWPELDFKSTAAPLPDVSKSEIP